MHGGLLDAGRAWADLNRLEQAPAQRVTCTRVREIRKFAPARQKRRSTLRVRRAGAGKMSHLGN